jgi:hypothetical protein
MSPIDPEIWQRFERQRIIAELQRRDRDRGLVEPKEPPHCSECFEGCHKCQPELFRRATL